MAGQVEPTVEQLRAALTPEVRINIEAAPGSGKTTVAAERFGMYRFRAGVDPRGVLALSFTRSARRELANRVRSRWGGHALAVPHAALTFDRLHQVLLLVLLQAGHITWTHSGDGAAPLDSWRGATGARLRNKSDARWIAKLSGTKVSYGASPAPYRGVWMSNPAGIRAQLGQGVHTHDDVRSLIHDALAEPALRSLVGAALTDRFQAVIVDEVYDANAQDLDLVALFCEIGLPVTLIGDRWQALYGFRGAQPNLVPGVLTGHGFVRHDVTRSFRYAAPVLERRMADLRDGAGLEFASGRASECDVVLSTGWDQLWKADAAVLPTGLGQPENKSVALMTLLLNRATTSRLGLEARNYPEACFVLGLPPEDAERDAVLDGFLNDLRADPSLTLTSLRSLHRQLGLVRRPPLLGSAKEAKLDETLQRLRLRLAGQKLVSGLSVHQAKGREYDRVGLRLKPADVVRLKQGLDPDNHEHRVLYVAVTRARRSTVFV